MSFDLLGSDPFEEYIYSSQPDPEVSAFASLEFAIAGETEDALAALPYSQFLETRYWRIVRDFVKYRANYECEECGDDYNLHVHHITYAHRGCEWRFLDDLECLCCDCHKRRHGSKVWSR